MATWLGGFVELVAVFGDWTMSPFPIAVTASIVLRVWRCGCLVAACRRLPGACLGGSRGVVVLVCFVNLGRWCRVRLLSPAAAPPPFVRVCRGARCVV